MARASIRVAFGLLAGLFALGLPLAPAGAAEAGCVVSIRYEGPLTAGSTEPWSLPLLRGQPDPDHLKRECPHAGSHPQLSRPLWEGPAWGLPSLGSFV